VASRSEFFFHKGTYQEPQADTRIILTSVIGSYERRNRELNCLMTWKIIRKGWFGQCIII